MFSPIEIAGLIPGKFSRSAVKIGNFEPRALKQTFARIYDETNATMAGFGHAHLLMPVRAAFLNQQSFMKQFTYATSMPAEGINFDNYLAFSSDKLTDGELSFDQYYNIDALRAIQNRTGSPAGSVILHEISATIYGDYLERANLSHGRTDSSGRIDLAKEAAGNAGQILASEGWGCYISQIPFDTEFLLQCEQAYLMAMDDPGTAIASEAIETIKERSLMDRHFLVALALTKIAMTGPKLLIPWMRTPPGAEPDGSNIGDIDIAFNFWDLYRKANLNLNMREFLGVRVGHIPFEDFGTGLVTAENLTK